MKRYLFFDLDHTLLKVNSSYCFGAYLFQHKQFSLFTMLRLVSTYTFHKIGWISISDVHHKIFHILFFPRSAKSILDFVCPFLDNKLPKMLNPSVYEVLLEAKRQGDHTVLLSSSPSFLVKEIASRLGLDEWQGSQYDVDQNGRFTKISHLIQGEEKARYVNELRKRDHLDKNDFVAYSDSHYDLPFLESVDKPIVVNPDAKLHRVAQAKNWPILF